MREDWDRSRLVYLKEHDMFDMQNVVPFIEKTIRLKREEERKRILDILDTMEDKSARNFVLFHIQKTPCQ